MKFLDHAAISVRAGRGGHGSRHFRREKHVPRGGPDGGDGGKGGDVVLIASDRARSLYDFHLHRQFPAEDGEQGGESRSTGRSGADLELVVPPGTALFDATTDQLIGDLLRDGDRLVVARGGNGGWGNWRFRSATRQAPDRANTGLAGEARSLRLELKLLADCALIGMPNAGKSTLIRAVSASQAEVADYPFTTLQPNLGVVRHRGRSFTVADVPGLIEGAAEGAGLGHQFLRHAERCHVLVYVLDPTQEPPPGGQLALLRRELEAYSPELARRPSILLLHKSDVLGPDKAAKLAALAAEMPSGCRGPLAASGATGEGVAALLDAMLGLLPSLSAAAAPTSYDPLADA